MSSTRQKLDETQKHPPNSKHCRDIDVLQKLANKRIVKKHNCARGSHMTGARMPVSAGTAKLNILTEKHQAGSQPHPARAKIVTSAKNRKPTARKHPNLIENRNRFLDIINHANT